MKNLKNILQTILIVSILIVVFFLCKTLYDVHKELNGRKLKWEPVTTEDGKTNIQRVIVDEK